MQTRQWTNRSLPQTLQIGLILLYIQGVSYLIFGLPSQFVVFPGSDVTFGGGVQNWPLRVALAVAFAVSGYLIANERKLGWTLGVVSTALPLVGRAMIAFGISASSIDINRVAPWRYDAVGLLFEVAIFALLVHPQSRDYKRIWFK